MYLDAYLNVYLIQIIGYSYVARNCHELYCMKIYNIYLLYVFFVTIQKINNNKCLIPPTSARYSPTQLSLPATPPVADTPPPPTTHTHK